MSSLVELMENLNTRRYDLESTHWVDVTHINQPDNFYVRPTAYRIYLKSLEAHDGPLEPSKITLGTVAVYHSKKIKRNVRGQVFYMREENGEQLCDMFSLDYGCIETVSAGALRKPSRVGMPALAVLCQLADCYPIGGTYSQKDIDALVFYVGDERAKMIVKAKTPDKLVVQLINCCPEDISTMLALTGFSVLGYGSNVVSRIQTIPPSRLYFTHRQLKVNDTIQVRVQCGDSLQRFFVCDVKDHAEFSAASADFWQSIKHDRTMREEDLTVGKGIAVHTGVKYERAVITEAARGRRRPVAMLVDCGKTTEIYANSQPKLLDKEFYFERPALALFCSAEEKQVWDNGLHRFLYPGFVFMITIVSVGEEFLRPHIVSMSKLKQ